MKNQKENSKNVQRSILFSPPDISDLEIAEVVEALKSGWITTGPRTKELEKRLAGFCHTSKVVCLNSATAAEELNFRICGIGEGDEVIVEGIDGKKKVKVTRIFKREEDAMEMPKIFYKSVIRKA